MQRLFTTKIKRFFITDESFLTKLMKTKAKLNVYFVFVPKVAEDAGMQEAVAQAKEGANAHWREIYKSRLAPSFRYRYLSNPQ